MIGRLLVLLSRLGFALARPRIDDESRIEIESHLEALTERYVRAGMPRADAAEAARRQFGSPSRVREDIYGMNGIAWLDAAGQDLRHASRMMWRQRGLTCAVALTLGVGVGVAGGIFSLVYALLLRPFPYPEPDRLVRVHTVPSRNPAQRGGLSVPEMEALRERASSFEDIGVYTLFDTNLGRDNAAQSVRIAWVTPGVFGVTGIAPILGRGFSPADDRIGGDNNKVVLGHHIWRDFFGGDPAVIGRQVRMRLMSYTVVGVMPPGYRFPSNADVWAPLQSYLNKFDRPLRLEWTGRGYSAIARLRPEATLALADAELQRIGTRLAAEHADSNRDLTYTAVSLRTAEIGPLRPYLMMLVVAVSAVVFIACANIASLLLTQALSRRREFAVRTAMGAGRARVIRQLVTESLVLAAAGAAVAVVVAWMSTRALAALLPVDLPAWMQLEMNWPVLLFSLGLAIVTSLLFGLAPAFEVTRTDLQTALRPSTGGTSRTGLLRRSLVVMEVALSCALLVISGLMVKTFLLLFMSPPGFNPDNLLTAFISPHRVGTIAETTRAYWQIYNRALEQLSSAPGVVAAGGATSIPYAFSDNERPRSRMEIRRHGDSGEPLQLQTWTNRVSPNYFGAMRIPILAGRDFSESDTSDRECVVAISARAAERIWGGSRALGETARFGWDTPPRSWCRIIAIVGNVRYRGSEDEEGIEVYWSYRQREAGSFYLVARTAGDPMDYATVVRNAVAAGDRETGIITLRSMQSSIGESLWRRRLWGVLLGAFAALAVALAAIGLYGVLAHSVRRRTREMGIRLALGARRIDAMAAVGREAAGLVAAGFGLGLLGGVLSARALAHLIFRVQPHDPSVLLATIVVLAGFAVVACVLPASRAASVDPATALRHDD